MGVGIKCLILTKLLALSLKIKSCNIFNHVCEIAKTKIFGENLLASFDSKFNYVKTSAEIFYFVFVMFEFYYDLLTLA